MEYVIHLADGTYFHGDANDHITTMRGIKHVGALKEGDSVRVGGWCGGDFLGDRIGRYVEVLVVRTVNDE